MTQGNYESISVRDVLDRINAHENGWFLPHIQRQYVWGSRDSSEEYICLLVDSLLRRFPIGGLVLWETNSKIPYREFLQDYSVGTTTRIVPEERRGNHKFLVYDGQQRLQTLYSVLFYSFNGRILYYDLKFDSKDKEVDETGFFFRNIGEPPLPNTISMVELLSCSSINDKIQLRDRLTNGLSSSEKELVEINFENLWSVFVERSTRSIAYFPVRSDNSSDVNEVFRRLNTGGIPLTQLEMVLAKIKEKAVYFEEELWDISRNITKATSETPGYAFSAHEIVQLIYLLVLNTARVDVEKINEKNIPEMINMLSHVNEVLPYFFKHFLFEGFHINAKWLVVRQQALLPLLAYCVTLEKRGYKWKIEQIDSKPLNVYFIKSQLCDWNTQTMVTAFSRLAINAAENNMPFPLDEITEIATKKNRTGDVYFYQLEGMKWFSLKILTPGRQYLFDGRTPHIDHIFPQASHDGLPDKEQYRQLVDVLWNMQPIPAEVNNYKRMKNPVDFFRSEEGKMFLASYDFLPDSLDDDVWQDEKVFIEYRKNKMIEFLRNRYNIELKVNPCIQDINNN